jgi:hypothetical protein
MPKSKKHTSKIYKVKKSNLRRSKRGGFSWSDISNWKPDFSNWKSKFTEKMNNFSIFKKKDTQLSSQIPASTTNELPETKPSYSSPSYSSPSYSSPSYSSPSYSSPSYSPPSNFSEDSFSSNKVTPLYEAPKINNSINDNDGFKNTLPPPSSPSFSSPSLGTQQNTITSFSDNEPKYSGGYRANHSLTNLASKAALFWQPTARPQVWVGGKIKKTYKSHKKNKKSYKKHKKSHKKHH